MENWQEGVLVGDVLGRTGDSVGNMSSGKKSEGVVIEGLSTGEKGEVVGLKSDV